MKIAILTRRSDHLSLRIYRENIVRELTALNITFTRFAETEPVPPACDLSWDPGLGMRRVPRSLYAAAIPVIVTVHGVRAFSLPSKELTFTWKERAELLILKKQLLSDWQSLRSKVSAVITVSNFGASELTSAFSVPKEIVHPVYHGIDHSVFNVSGPAHSEGHPYMFAVSRYRPVKNVERLFAAHAAMQAENRPALVTVLPDCQENFDLAGVRVIKKSIDQTILADYYRGALCAVQPSLRESFSFPVIEAMACGCPVITANSTGCAEVAGDAALLVDPRSVDNISQAMTRLAKDSSLRETLRYKGISRARHFTWQKSAQDHLKVFQGVLGGTA